MSLSKKVVPLLTVKIQNGLLSIKMIVSTFNLVATTKISELCPLTIFVLCNSCRTDTNDALHFYSSDNARVTNGVMNITTEEKVNEYRAFNEKTKKFYADKKHIQSGMLQGWNKFCLTGGIVEFRAKLPGDSGTGGLWPACECVQSMISILVYARVSLLSPTHVLEILQPQLIRLQCGC
jgi:hypothetical protein